MLSKNYNFLFIHLHHVLVPVTCFFFVAPSSSPALAGGNATGSRSLHLEWSPPPPDTHNGVIRSYTILLLEQDTGLTTRYEATNTSLSIASLHPFYVYQCQVQAFTVRHGPLSEPVFITTWEEGKSSTLYFYFKVPWNNEGTTDGMQVLTRPTFRQLFLSSIMSQFLRFQFAILPALERVVILLLIPGDA